MKQISVVLSKDGPNPHLMETLTPGQKMVTDLNSHLDQAADRQKRMNLIAKKTGLHPKTLQRLMRSENQPSYITVFKIYRYLLNENDDNLVIEKCPEIIRNYLKKANPQQFVKDFSYTSDVEAEIIANPVAIELVILCAAGPMTGEEIKDRFGSYGYDIVRKLVAQDILAEPKTGLFVAGRKQMNMSPETVVKVGIQIATNHAKAENGYVRGLHFHGFFAEGLSAEAYNQWLKIDEEAFHKKIELSRKPQSQGTIKTYTFMSTDTMDRKENT
jgi:DNA-binding phage protein